MDINIIYKAYLNCLSGLKPLNYINRKYIITKYDEIQEIRHKRKKEQ